jgi:cell division protein FtsB
MRMAREWMVRLRQSRLKIVFEGWSQLRQWLGEDDGSWNETAPRPFLLFLSLFGVAMVAISLFGDQGWFAYRSLSSQAYQLRQEVADLETREQDLVHDIHALRSDPAAIEKVARAKLGLVKPGETVIQLPRPSAQ